MDLVILGEVIGSSGKALNCKRGEVSRRIR